MIIDYDQIQKLIDSNLEVKISNESVISSKAKLRSWDRIGTRGRTSVETWASAGEDEDAAGRTPRQKSRRGYGLAER